MASGGRASCPLKETNMGAEQIGYLLIGPKELSEEAIEKAHKRDFEVANLITAYWRQLEDEEQNNTTLPSLLSHLYSAFDHPCELERWEDMDVESVRKIVDDFVSFWHDPQYRDTHYRYFADQQILFAGGMSWGDEPDGGGYSTIKEACVFDIPKTLGIH